MPASGPSGETPSSQATSKLVTELCAMCSLSSSGNHRQHWVVNLHDTTTLKIPPYIPLTFIFPRPRTSRKRREDSSHPRRRHAAVSSQAPPQLCPHTPACLSSIMKVLLAAVFVLLCTVALCSHSRGKSAVCSPLSVATHTLVRSPACVLWLKNPHVKLKNIEWGFKNDMVAFFKKLQKECIDLGCRLELREVLSYILGEKLEV